MSKSYSIVGMEYRKATEFVAAMTSGQAVTLVREPTNRFDPNAVMVWVNDPHVGWVHVGYIPKSQNKVLATFIDQTGVGYEAESLLAMDQKDLAASRAIDAKFVRSPNSKYPMVEV